MAKTIDSHARDELVRAIGERYRASRRAEKQILDEFVAVTGFHRKHAIRVRDAKIRPRTSRDDLATTDAPFNRRRDK